MLWIRDILVRIRMRIRIFGSVPLSRCGSGRSGNIRILRIRTGCGSVTLVKSHKEVTTVSSRNQGLSYYFCLIMEGSGNGAGSVLVTNGSVCGSGRPKNIRIRVHSTSDEWNQVIEKTLMCVQDGCVEPLPGYHRPEVALGEIWWCLRPSGSGRRIDWEKRGQEMT